MKLKDIAMKFDKPDLPVIPIDAKMYRVAFEGTADGLPGYSGLEIDIKGGVIRISIK